MAEEMVYIHHLELNGGDGAESLVPPITVVSYCAQGWIEGPLPSAQAARDEAHAKVVADVEAVQAKFAEEQQAEADAEAERLTLAATVAIVPVDDLPAPPPRGGKHSGLEERIAYAEANDIPLAPDLTRDEVIAVVEDVISRSTAAAADETPSGDTTDPLEGGTS